MSKIIEFLKEKNMNYADVVTLCKNQTLRAKTDDFLTSKEENFSYRIEFSESDDFIIVFSEEIDLKICDKDNKICVKKIRCNLDILDYLTELKIDIKNVIINKNDDLHLEEKIGSINKYIKDNQIFLNELKFEMPKIIRKDIIEKNIEIKPEEYSEFFFEYFEYENKEKVSLKYEINENRKKIEENLDTLKQTLELKQYKLTGPSSIGKSMSLIFYSRGNYNVIYINLKVLNKNKDDKEKCKKIITSELSRLRLTNNGFDDINNRIKLIDSRCNVLKLLLNIIGTILENYKMTIMLIFDQYKEKNYDYYNKFNDHINLLKKKYNRLKLVYCSSINDNSIRDGVLETFIKFDGLIEEYNTSTQKYYFYYADIYTRPEHKNKKTINWIFNNRQKYISMFKSNEKSWEAIYKTITDKMDKKLEEFNVSSYKGRTTNKNSQVDLFVFIKKILDEEYNIKQIYSVLRYCPLKYVKVIFNEDKFIVKPIYPFIKYYINNKINKAEAFNYFLEKKYNTYSFHSNRIKGEYFEYCAQIALRNNNIINLPNKDNKEITLYEIKDMNEFSESINDIIKEYKLEDINENEKISKETANINEINKVKEQNPFKQNELFNIFDNNEQSENKKTEQNDNNKSNNNLEKKYVIIGNKINKKLIPNEKKINDKMDDKMKKRGFVDNLIDKLNIDNNKIEENKINNEYISENAKKYLKTIEDYRKELINEYKSSRIYDDKNINALMQNTAKKKFIGNENIFLFQSKENGELIDYGILYGEKTEKIILLFQMKCYGEKSSLDKKFLDKIYIKEKLKKILFNSISMFNCKIIKWYYYLVFYFNPNDSIRNQLKNDLFEKYSKLTQCLLYNPEKNIFYSNYKTEINELPLSDKANLDFNSEFLFNQENFIYKFITPKFDKVEIDYYNCLNMFIEKFQILKKNDCDKLNLKQILNKIKAILKIEDGEIYYETTLPMKKNYLSYPSSSYIFFYEKKNSDNFIALINQPKSINNSEFIFFDLEKKKQVDELLIDLDSKNIYCIYFEKTNNEFLTKKRCRSKDNEKFPESIRNKKKKSF